MILRELGRGGMGVVYEAYDRDRDERVALKTLRNLDASSLYRFKQEFRALAYVTHPNLVALYELIADEDQWFFTMELLEGTDFLTHVRCTTAGDGTARSPGLPPNRVSGHTNTTRSMVSAPPVRVERADLSLLRPALAQLAGAIQALHDSGHLHRDIKPSNVIVSPAGHVSVVDFGIVMELRTADAGGEIIGTPSYMAPEQARPDGSPTPASDWYSLGVILYTALTGQRPFAGATQEVIDAKLLRSPPPPGSMHPDVPADLDALCVELLQRDPAKRPAGADILRRLSHGAEARQPGQPRPRAAAELVGRERHLAALYDALGIVQRGSGMTVLVRGRSGMGKTVLVRHFLDDIARRDDVAVLSGRCHERESVPYKALDSLVDSLCRFLLALPRHEADALMPLDVPALARAFPVLRRVEAVARGRRHQEKVSGEPLEQRRRAFAALKELIARLAATRLVVLHIDDLQWGDADSAPLLADLMRPPMPPFLFVAAFRSEEAESSSLVSSLTSALDDPSMSDRMREVSVSRLPLPEARRLVRELLPEASDQAAERIARESRGNPYFIREFILLTRKAGTIEQLGSMTLESVILARVGALPEAARRVLEALAVAGRPIVQAIARDAVALGSEGTRAFAELKQANLVRTAGPRSNDLAEVYHDRIREIVVSKLSRSELAAHHLALAQTIETTTPAEVEPMAIHFAAGGRWDAARHYAVRAGDQAAEALAFERAGELYRLALKLGPDHEESHRTLERLGDVLASAGRGVDSARAYLEAADRAADSAKAILLRATAAGQFMRSGYVDEAMGTLRPTLEAVRLKLPRTQWAAIASVLIRRTYLQLRGTWHRRRDAAQIPPESLTRIDVAYAGTALSMVDVVRGTDLQARHLALALRAGEPYRVARALALDAAISSVQGVRGVRRAHRMLGRIDQVFPSITEPVLLAVVKSCSALPLFQAGRWRACLDAVREAEAIYRNQCSGVAFEQASVQLWWLWSLYYLGELEELAERGPVFLREAEERDDRYAIVCLSTGLPSMWQLAADDAGGMRRRATEAFEQWSRHGYHLQHYWTSYALAQCDLYEGNARAAYERMAVQLPEMGRAFLLKIPTVRAEALYLRGSCAVAAAEADPAFAAAALREAGRDANRLRRMTAPWAKAMSTLLRAAISRQRGDLDGAAALLATAAAQLDAGDMRLFAELARRRRGEIIQGDEGKALVRASDEWMTAQGIRRPGRWAALLAPGFDA